MGNIEIEFEELEQELEIELAEENGLPLGFYESKNDLKNVANEHGGEITDETPFADYAPEFDRVIKSKAENVTAELEKTQAELTETQGKLTATESELSETKSTLETTRGELADTKEDLEEAIAAQITARPLTVTENGTYTANEKEAFNPVTVEVKPDKATMVKEFIKARGTANGLFYLSPLEDVSDLIEWDTFEGKTTLNFMFRECAKLKSVPLFDTSAVKHFSDFIRESPNIKTIPAYDTSSMESMDGMFRNATGLEYLPMLNTRKVIYCSYACYNCGKLKEIPSWDLRQTRAYNNMFTSCFALENIWIKNIKANLQIGSGTSWGHLLTLESLIHLISELRDAGGTRTFTVGSANLEKLANVYVRPVEITDEMREKDDLIDEKLPFEVCESTDEGAVLITQYAKFKNWDIQ